MSDKYKGFIVHLDKDLHDEGCEKIVNAINAIKHVSKVVPLVSEFEDWIAYERGMREAVEKMNETCLIMLMGK